jgi:hypothetical protein
MKKKEFAESLARKMSDETNTRRDAKNVLNKIHHIERKWREAHNWANATGAGIKETDGESSFEEIVRKRCPYYFDLLDVMVDEPLPLPKSQAIRMMTKKV